MKGPTAQGSFQPQKLTVCPEPATPGAGIAAVAAAAVGGEGEVLEEAEALIHVPAMARAPWPSAGSWVSGWQSSGLSGLTGGRGPPRGCAGLGWWRLAAGTHAACEAEEPQPCWRQQLLPAADTG